MPKNIIVFADGTGQEGGRGNNTNVYDLFNIIEDRTERQISYYDKGLGTGWRKVTGNISGAGISKNIKECYEFIFRNYAAGDQIYLFGFSRGATTVRTLSAFIHRFGILPQSRPELIDQAYAIYKIRNKEKRRRKADEFIRGNHTMWCRVKFLGVWDTVAALGLPFKVIDAVLDKIPFFRHSFHDLKLSKSVDYARHALAIDDERKVFHPTLWDETDEDSPSKKNSKEFSADDISDVNFVAAKLRTAVESAESPKEEQESENGSQKKPADPLSRYLESELRRENSELLQLIKEFDPEKEPVETENAIPDLKKGLADLFNRFIVANGPSLYSCLRSEIRGDEAYDPKDDEKYAGIVLSEETRDFIKSTKPHIAKKKRTKQEKQHLNRLLLEDAYKLSRLTFPKIKQVWFAGMHTDVGGGYPERGLSHIPLVWMLSEATELGLLIFENHHTEIRPNAAGKMHDSREKFGKYIFSRRERFWDANKNRGRQPLVHESVVIRQKHENLAYEPWILKRTYEVEHWPQRLKSSVQFDDHYIWREAFWGWGGAFTIPWSSIQHINYDKVTGTLILHPKEEDREKVVIKGSLNEGANELMSEFERRRAQALDDKQDREELNKVVNELKNEINELKDQLKTRTADPGHGRLAPGPVET